jgi:hypothetical protein
MPKYNVYGTVTGGKFLGEFEAATPEEAKMHLRIKPFKPTFLMFVRDCSGNLEENWLPFLSKNR